MRGKKRHVFLLILLLSATFLEAQEGQKHTVAADVTAMGLVGYNHTLKWYEGVDLKGGFHYDNIDFALNLEALTKDIYSVGLTVKPSFEVCRNGFVFLDGTMHSRIFRNYKAFEFVYAGSVGFMMRHFSIQAGVFSKTIDAIGRDWHAVENSVTEPFNVLYKVNLSIMGFDNPWDIYIVGANFNEFEYERVWVPFFTLGGRYDIKEKWSIVAEGMLKPAGMFHGIVKYYESVFRVGVSFRLERSGMDKSPKK